MELRGKTVLVTGGSSGIGAAVAWAAASEGARITLVSRDRGGLDRIAGDIERSGAWVRSFAVDLASPRATRDTCARIEREVGVPDVIVNSAGQGRWLYLDETAEDDVVAMMAVPYFAAAFVTRAFLPQMLERGSGFIVNVTSLAAFMPWAGATGYTAARWAMRGFSEALRADVRDTGVRVLLATFAKVDSPYWQHNPGSMERVPGAQKLIGALTPEQAGSAIVRGILRNERYVSSPWMLRVVLALGYCFPMVSRWLVYRTSHQRGRSGVRLATK